MSLDPERTEPLPADMRTINMPANREAIDHPMVEREVTRATSPGLADGGAERPALFESDLLDNFNARWTEVQTSFVDEPRRAVEQADALVSDVIQRIGDSFSRERSQLEQQWDRGDDVSTEDLRQALQRYRSFFSRLLAV
jgi:hypothetical protein